ncbi:MULTISPECIES: DedA family protein [Streptomyces]|uniref:Membrane protein n=1 Tax=Streptomyces filamentosus TaxID=67294 RepID=A0A919BYA0_STRFL|nr:VTT domain-containing protein [Streptomyces filamentosus]GHG29209.1 membrane protein [Streptomyces filamentosus]
MNFLTDTLAHIPAPAAYALLAAVVFAESVLLAGTLAPTLALLLTAGALAHTGHLDLPLVITVSTIAAIAGDLLAHSTGRLLGDRLRTGRLGRRVPAPAWHRAESLMARRGGQAVLLSRFVPVLRTLTPHLAGATRLPYRHIALYSALAAPAWAAAEAGAGYAAADSIGRLLTFGGPALALAALTAAGLLVIRAQATRRRSHR